jgi:hypothetical protein
MMDFKGINFLKIRDLAESAMSFQREGGMFTPLLRRIVRAVRRLRQPRNINRYKPEKHYMRGPGPKSLSKRDSEPGPRAA